VVSKRKGDDGRLEEGAGGGRGRRKKEEGEAEMRSSWPRSRFGVGPASGGWWWCVRRLRLLLLLSFPRHGGVCCVSEVMRDVSSWCFERWDQDPPGGA